jgi:tRNA A-37 threonylcarbamoyl transferase component Bud32
MSASADDKLGVIGRVFGEQFRIDALIGRGGMGEIYLAEQLGLGRRVVLKLLHNARLTTAEQEPRFRREARVLAQLNHPNIVQLYAFGQSDDGITYLAMEYVEGQTLSALIEERGGQPELLVLGLLEQISSALVEAHRHGIVHRDLKPENVMMGERYVKVLDFGIAKLMHTRDMRLTHSGMFLGTPLYMAPEQLREQQVDERADIYALGVIGYELLTAELPFDSENSETPMDYMMRVLEDEPTPLSHKVPVSQAFEALIMRCLAKDPAQRFQTSLQLQAALAALRGNAPSTGHEATVQRSPALSLQDEHDFVHAARARRKRRARVWTIAVCAVVGLSIGVGAGFWREISGSPAADANSGAPLGLREWVQGMPFPQGTSYDAFEPEQVDAHVDATPERVLAFYRVHLREKWSGVQEHGDELVIADPTAPIETIRVSALQRGSRVVVKRRVRD